jgi:hypothetical protein
LPSSCVRSFSINWRNSASTSRNSSPANW